MSATKEAFRTRIVARLREPATYLLGSKQYRPVYLDIDDSHGDRTLTIYVRVVDAEAGTVVGPIDIEAICGLAVGDPPGRRWRDREGPGSGPERVELAFDENTVHRDGLKIRTGIPTYKFTFKSRFSEAENLERFRESLSASIDSSRQHEELEVRMIREAIGRVADITEVEAAVRAEARACAANFIETADEASAEAKRLIFGYYGIGILTFLGILYLVDYAIPFDFFANRWVSIPIWGGAYFFIVEIMRRALSRAQRRHSISRIYWIAARQMIKVSRGNGAAERALFEEKKREIQVAIDTGIEGCQQAIALIRSPDMVNEWAIQPAAQ